MTVHILIDSSAGLPTDIAEELDIMVLDLHVLEDGGERSTAGLSALELTAAYARLLERGGDDGVVALHISKELSSTWSAALTAAAVFDGLVEVIDTQSAGMAIGAAAMAAAKVAADGGTLKECVDMARDTLARAETWLYLHRLEEIRRSGRISTAAAVVSTTLATKPIMQLRKGKLELAIKTRTQSKAFVKLTDLINERADGEPVFVAIQQCEAREAAKVLEKQLVEALPEGSTFMITDMDRTLAVHAGAGALGVSTVFSQHPGSDED